MLVKVLLLTLGYLTAVCYTEPVDRNSKSIRNRRQFDLETADALLEEPLFREDVSSVSFDQQFNRRSSEPALQSSPIVDAAARSNFPSRDVASPVATKEVSRTESDFRKEKAIFPAATAILTPDALVNGQIVIPAVFSKFHSQDELGQASFGHVTADQSTVNIRDGLGNQIGHFTYINPEGKEVIVHYTAGVGGFRVLSNAQTEPSAGVTLASPAKTIVEDSPDVIKARQEHLALFEEARTRIKHPKILQSISAE